jgi:hypothetical protein
LVDPHLVFGNLYAPLLHDVADEFHSLVLEDFLGLFLVEIVIVEYFFHEFGVDVCAFALDHVECFSVHKFFFDLVLGECALGLDVVDDESSWVYDWIDVDCLRLHV